MNCVTSNDVIPGTESQEVAELRQGYMSEQFIIDMRDC